DLARVIARCLAKDPAARFRTAGELLAALERVDIRSKRSWRRERLILLLGAVVAAAISVLGMRQRHEAPRASVATGSSALVITALLPLPSRSTDALAGYARAMQAYRAGDGGQAEDDLRQALEFDPGLAAAHWHLALEGQLSYAEQHEHFQRAV